MKLPAARTVVDLSVPLAMLACLGALALTLDDPQNAAETGYLAVLAAAVLVPLAALPRRLPYGVESAAVLVAALVWALPAGDTRGAAVALVVTGCAAVEIGRGVERSGAALPWSFVLPAAIALQMLFRADRLLAPTADLHTLAGLVGLPLAGGAAVAFLWPRCGLQAALAAGLLLALAPGWRVASVLTLAALAAAAWLRRRPRLAGAVLLAVVAVGSLWRPAFGPLLALAAASYLAGDRWRVQLLLGGATVAAALVPLAPRGWDGAVAGGARWLLLLPAVAALERRRWALAAAALMLGFAGGSWLAEPAAAWAPAVALGALSLRGPRAALRLQLLWTGFLTFGCALLACYPWLRGEPIGELVRRLGVRTDPGSTLLVALAFGLLVAALGLAHRHTGTGQPRPGVVGLLALGIALVAALPNRGHLPMTGDAFVLDSAHPTREAGIDPPAAFTTLVVDSYLSQGLQVPAGKVVARVAVAGARGGAFDWEIVAGTDTGEWAARRPDVAGLPGLSVPDPWLSWVAPEAFFAQRYRAVRQIPRPIVARSVRIALAEDLPADVALAVFHLELRR